MARKVQLQDEEKLQKLLKQKEILQEIQRWREEVHQARSTQKLERLLDAPYPQALVRAMPAQELLYTVKDIGLEECADLVLMASREQIRYCLDLDCWDRDHLDHDRLGEWFSFLLSGDLEAAGRVMDSLDPEVLVLYFRDMIRVYDLHHEEESLQQASGELIYTPDRYYVVEVLLPPEERRSTLVRLAVEMVVSRGFSFSHWFLESVRCGLSSELEELSYQFSKGRREDLGFVDFYDALEVYQPPPPGAVVEEERPREEGVASPLRVPMVYLQHQGEGLFARAMRQLDEQAYHRRLEEELYYLANKIMSVERVTGGEPEYVRKVLGAVEPMLDLGLEVLDGWDLEAASRRLRSMPLEWVFRSGMKPLSRLRNQAQQLVRDPRWVVEEETSLDLWEEEEREGLEALQQARPLFDRRWEEPPGEGLRPFGRLVDVERAEAFLASLRFWVVLFFERFAFEAKAIGHAAKGEALPETGALRFSHLFLAALVRYQLEGEFQPAPLSLEEVRSFLADVFPWEEEAPRRVRADFQQRVATLLQQMPGASPAEQRQALSFLEKIWRRLEECCGEQASRADLTPSSLSAFWIRL